MATDPDLLDEAPTFTPGVRPGTPGQCITCNKTMADQRRWYCDDCRPAKHKGPKGSPGTVAERRAARRRQGAAPSTAKAPTAKGPRLGTARVSDAAASRTLQKLLIILSLMIMSVQVRRHGIADPTGDIVEELGFTDDEAAAFGNLAARTINASSIGASVLAPIVNNEDIVIAAYTGYSYFRRTSNFFDNYNRRPRATVTPMRPTNTQPRPVDVDDTALFDDTAPVESQVIIPDTPVAPAEVMAVASPLQFDARGHMTGSMGF